jgi:uncharacterized membrane protein
VKRDRREAELGIAISYVLIFGVLASVAIEAYGIINYYLLNRNLNVAFNAGFSMKGTDFFNYAAKLGQQLSMGMLTPEQILGLGIVVLMVTPFLRVIASVVYFGWVENRKYLFITLFVLIVLTASLLNH